MAPNTERRALSLDEFRRQLDDLAELYLASGQAPQDLFKEMEDAANHIYGQHNLEFEAFERR